MRKAFSSVAVCVQTCHPAPWQSALWALRPCFLFRVPPRVWSLRENDIHNSIEVLGRCDHSIARGFYGRYAGHLGSEMLAGLPPCAFPGEKTQIAHRIFDLSEPTDQVGFFALERMTQCQQVSRERKSSRMCASIHPKCIAPACFLQCLRIHLEISCV